MLRRLYTWTLDLAARPHAFWALAAISFIESSIFPIPPDVVLIAMVIARPKSAWAVATVCTVASVLGGFAGYAIGYFFFDAFGADILAFYGLERQFADFRGLYDEWGFWFVMMAGFTPFPYKVITIASGVFGLDLLTFALASVVSRGARFFLVAALLWRFGAPIKAFIDKHLGWLTLVFMVLLIGGFVAIKYLF
jgi:membrane protein YqaA with SNARE-associated domain